MSKPSRRGLCGKNRLIKRGLTSQETNKVETFILNNRKRWEYLFSLNKWTPQTK